MWKRRFESTSVILQHLNLSSWIAVQIDDLAFETTHWIRLNEINDFKQLFRLGSLGFVYEYVQEHFHFRIAAVPSYHPHQRQQLAFRDVSERE